MKKWFVLNISILFLFTGVYFFTNKIGSQLRHYKLTKEKIAEELNFENRILSIWEWVPGNTIGQDKVLIWQKLELKAEAYYNGALFYGACLFMTVILFMLINIFYYKKRSLNNQVNGILMIIAALSFLYVGLSSPFLEIHAYNKDLTFKIPLNVDLSGIDLPYLGNYDLGNYEYQLDQVFEGRTYYLYQNKSVLELIILLYTGGNYLIAIVLIVFSILFPLIKLISSLGVLIRPKTKQSRKTYDTIKSLGKWSMADVFVSAIFLGVFSFANIGEGIDTGATTLIGTYFYLLFVLFSIGSGKYLKKVIDL